MDSEAFADEENAVAPAAPTPDVAVDSSPSGSPTSPTAQAPSLPPQQQPGAERDDAEAREPSTHSAKETTGGAGPGPAASADEKEGHGENEDEEEDGDGEGEEGDGGYAAEFRSLLFRVADLAAQEGQRVQQGDFALRMTQREARLLTAAATQQQAYLSQHSDAAISPSVHADRAGASPATSAPPCAADAAGAVAADARLATLAHRIDAAQQQQRRGTDAAGLLSSHRRTLRADAAHEAAVQDVAAELLLRLCAWAGLPAPATDDGSDPAEDGETSIGDVSFNAGAEGAAPAAASDLWQKQATGLATLGGTLAKVHALFADAECRTHMSVIATALTEVGRQSQHVLQELQGLTAAELRLEADLAQRRGCALEWGLFAAHAQQALEMRDLYAPATVEEMRAVALRKVLLRRRQELQSALTVLLLRVAERHCSSEAAAEAAAGSATSTPPSPCSFSSPPHEVTPEVCKATADACTHYDGLRDRLWRELLYLKKCARRTLGPAWVAGAEACGLASVTAHTGERADARAVTAVLEDDLRRATYDAIARLLRLVAAAPLTPVHGGGDGEESAESPDGSVGREAAASAEAERATPSPPGSPSSVAESAAADLPSPRLKGRVRVLSLMEAVQTRTNSLVALLIETAKHWQRTLDGVVEVQLCAGGTAEDAWRRAADLLLQRCTANGHDGAVAPVDAAASESSPVLAHEQRLLDRVHTAQSGIVAAMNAALARVRDECVTPLEEERRAVAVLLRLLQLADEAMATTPGNAAHCLTTTSTPALESTAQLLRASPPSTADAMGALDGPPLCLPGLPRRAETVQAALRPLSAASAAQLTATTAPLRAAVAETQATLDQYAQYSMAEVPALLEKAQAATKELHARLAESVARDSQSAALALEIEERRTALTQVTTTGRTALSSAVDQARAEVAELQAHVAQLQARRAVQAAEAEARATGVCAAEAEAWRSLLKEAPQPESESEEEEEDAVGEDRDSAAAVKDEAEEDAADAVVKKEGDGEEENGVGALNAVDAAAPAPPVADDVNTAGAEVVKREEDEEHERRGDEVGEDATAADGHTSDASADEAEEPPVSTETDARDAGEAEEEAAPTTGGAAQEGEASTAENSLNAARTAPVSPATATPPPPPPAQPRTPQRTPPPPQQQQQQHLQPKLVSPPRTVAPQHKKQHPPPPTAQWPHHQHQQQQQLQPPQPFMWSAQQPMQQHAPQGQFSILGDSVPGGVSAAAAAPAQRPPVFGGPVGGSAFGPASAPAPSQPVLPTPATNRPVFETSPFFSNFGFEEEDE